LRASSGVATSAVTVATAKAGSQAPAIQLSPANTDGQVMRPVVGTAEIAARLGVRRWYTIGEGDLLRSLN